MIEAGSVEFEILEKMCGMARPVRGISEAMLLRAFRSPKAIRNLAGAGLIRRRGWHDGPGAIWIPTEAGESAFVAARRGVSRA